MSVATWTPAEANGIDWPRSGPIALGRAVTGTPVNSLQQIVEIANAVADGDIPDVEDDPFAGTGRVPMSAEMFGDMKDGIDDGRDALNLDAWAWDFQDDGSPVSVARLSELRRAIAVRDFFVTQFVRLTGGAATVSGKNVSTTHSPENVLAGYVTAAGTDAYRGLIFLEWGEDDRDSASVMSLTLRATYVRGRDAEEDPMPGWQEPVSIYVVAASALPAGDPVDDWDNDDFADLWAAVGAATKVGEFSRVDGELIAGETYEFHVELDGVSGTGDVWLGFRAPAEAGDGWSYVEISVTRTNANPRMPIVNWSLPQYEE